MTDDVESVLSLPPEAVPPALQTWLKELGQPAVLASIELLPDGRLVVQTLPGVDPRFVARVRRTLAQYEDVLRRLS